MPDPPEQLAAILNRARPGDQAAMTQLAQQYEFKVRLVARYLLGPALRPYLDSMDLVQSVHHTVMLGLRQNKFAISSPESLMALALTLVRRKAARQWRHAQRQQRLDGGTAKASSLSHVLTSLSSPDADPARSVQFTEQVQCLCDRLEETERRLLELRMQGYSPVEIAAQIGLTNNAIYVRLSRL